MSRFLIVTWDGAGNLLPTLGIARRLVDAGHEVRLLGHRSIDERFGQHGWSYRPFDSAPEFDAVRPGDPAQEMGLLVENVFFGADVARDTLAEIQRSAPDGVVVDALMLTAISAAEASGVPTAALMHTAYSLFRVGPLLEMVSAAMPMLNGVRDELGLDPVAGIPELHDRTALRLVSSVRELEPPAEIGPGVVFIGPVLDAPQPVASAPAPRGEDGPEPLVLVSFSTSDMGQALTLQRLLDALAPLQVRVVVTTGPAVSRHALRAPANALIVGQVPHAPILARASLVVTHAGLGTVMAALAHGVPMVCMPMGRDQFFNAQRVVDLAVGVAVASDAEGSGIADAVIGALADPTLASAAKQLATVIATYPGAAGAVAELEALVEANA